MLIQPEIFAEAYQLLHQGQLSAAKQAFMTLAETDPRCKEAWFHLGEIAQSERDYVTAISHYERVLTLDSQVQEVYNSLGVIAAEQGELNLAIQYYFKALEVNPQYALAHHNVALLFLQMGQAEMGMMHLRQAIQNEAKLESLYFQKGIEAGSQGHFIPATLFFQAVVAHGGALAAAAALKQGFCFHREGLDAQALQAYAEAEKLRPGDDTAQVMQALYLPVVYRSEADLAEWQTRFERGLQALEAQAPLRLPYLQELDVPTFYLAYQGAIDPTLFQRVAQLLRAQTQAMHPAQPRREGRKRMAMVSRFFSQHPVARCFPHVLRTFPPRDFERWLVLVPGSRQDATTQALMQDADHVLTLSPHLPEALAQLQALDLDLLLYPDMGMEPFTYLLGLHRLARLQAVLSGHPSTTGLPDLDLFVSETLLEGPDAASRYTEELLCLEPMLAHVQFPVLPIPADRLSLGLPEGNLYLCPATAQKLHPTMDTRFRAILEADPQAQLVLFRDQSAGVSAVLAQRLQAAFGEVLMERVHFLPWQPEPRFLQMLAHAGAVLDPHPFGSGTTAFLTVAVGAPLITQPDQALRGRGPWALYQRIGMDDCIAADEAEYVQLALAFAQDPRKRADICQRLQVAGPQIFARSEGAQALVVELTHRLNSL
jgi:protein O-GlcNAc transferase